MKKGARWATAFHEAGHAVAAWRLRIRLHGATIVPTIDASGQVEYANPLRGINLELDNSNRARLRSELLMMVLLAGPEDQRQYSPRSWRSCHGGYDFGKAADLALNFNGYEDAANAYVRWVEIRTRYMINDLWWAVEKVAGALIEQESLSGKQIKRIILTDGTRSRETGTLLQNAAAMDPPVGAASGSPQPEADMGQGGEPGTRLEAEQACGAPVAPRREKRV